MASNGRPLVGGNWLVSLTILISLTIFILLLTAKRSKGVSCSRLTDGHTDTIVTSVGTPSCYVFFLSLGKRRTNNMIEDMVFHV